MLTNVVLAFVLPWCVGVWLYRKSPRIVLTIAPFTSVVAFVINTFGIYLGFWVVFPTFSVEALSTLPFDLGIYPVLASLLIFMIQQKSRGTSIFFIMIVSLVTTALEFTYVLSRKVIYGQGWNIGWTFVSYLVPYSLVYGYHRIIERHFDTIRHSSLLLNFMKIWENVDYLIREKKGDGNNYVEEGTTNDVLAYVVDRFRQAGLTNQEIIALVRSLKEHFDLTSEDEVEVMAERYLKSSNIEHRTSNIEHRTSNIEHRRDETRRDE